jgi:hypothetical protein
VNFVVLQRTSRGSDQHKPSLAVSGQLPRFAPSSDRLSNTDKAGIDLVAENNGHPWAIKAKAYADGNAIPKRELNKFLAKRTPTSSIGWSYRARKSDRSSSG